ncbi:MAG TPA: peptide deformylase [Desulfobacteraceae bacterium]|nr:peptide deformylase [Desulfobacteraceae bacterium]
MAILEIIEYPAPSLLQESLPVETIDDTLKTLVKDMGETMFDAPGVGLAAPQVGKNIRLIVYNPLAGSSDETEAIPEEEQETPEKKLPEQEFRAIVNPEITAASGSIVSEKEACLSVPDYSSDVKRFETVTVKGLDLDGTEIDFEAHGIQAIIMQHEIDHLDGTLYIDRISALKRNMYKKKINKKRKASK